jgi:hypothetical protein
MSLLDNFSKDAIRGDRVEISSENIEEGGEYRDGNEWRSR